jgi:hypothetical protein
MPTDANIPNVKNANPRITVFAFIIEYFKWWLLINYAQTYNASETPANEIDKQPVFIDRLPSFPLPSILQMHFPALSRRPDCYLTG